MALYIRYDLAAECVCLAGASLGNCEFQVLHLERKNLVLINVYRPGVTTLEAFTQVIGEISAKIDELGTPLPTIIVMGDFNLPDIDWDRASTITSSQARTLFNFWRSWVSK